jgi:serine/threonine protein kinase
VARVRHSNLLQFLGAVRLQPSLMLITEYLAGGDLHELLTKEIFLPAPLSVKYSLDIARGMCYLLNGPNAIIHGDLNP